LAEVISKQLRAMMTDELRNKAAAMEKLKARVNDVAKSACAPGTRVVWGEGPLDASIAFVGEAPGATETQMLRPFIGPAGRLLDAELEEAGIRRTDVWVTGSVKSRPTATGPSGRLRNRPPTTSEVQLWLPILRDELSVLRPRIIVCLGSVAARALIDPRFHLTEQRGRWRDSPRGPRLIATFHPSYILRRLAVPGAQEPEQFRSDLREVARICASDGQA